MNKRVKSSDSRIPSHQVRKKKLDETEYLKASKANELALDRSIKQVEDGDVVKIAFEDLWK